MPWSPDGLSDYPDDLDPPVRPANRPRWHGAILPAAFLAGVATWRGIIRLVTPRPELSRFVRVTLDSLSQRQRRAVPVAVFRMRDGFEWNLNRRMLLWCREAKTITGIATTETDKAIAAMDKAFPQ